MANSDGLLQRFRKIIDEIFKSQIEFADRTGIPKQTVQRWYSKDDLDFKISDAAKIVTCAGVNLEWLIFGKGEMKAVGSKSQKWVTVPVYSGHIAGGFGGVEEGYTKYEHAYRAEFADGKSLGKHRVTGNSMDAGVSIGNGDTVLVDYGQKKLIDGKIFVFETDDGAIVKEIELRPDGSVVLKSKNPEFDDILIEKENRSSLRVRGQVIETTRLLF